MDLLFGVCIGGCFEYCALEQVAMAGVKNLGERLIKLARNIAQAVVFAVKDIVKHHCYSILVVGIVGFTLE